MCLSGPLTRQVISSQEWRKAVRQVGGPGGHNYNICLTKIIRCQEHKAPDLWKVIMNIRRAIVIFPRFNAIDIIESLRKKYAPLSTIISPHLTLVFPFESDISKEILKEHIVLASKAISPFELVMKGITGTSDHYLYLNVKKGNDILVKLHDNLYNGILNELYDHRYTFIPHVTIGHLTDEESFNKAIYACKPVDLEFKTIVNTISVVTVNQGVKSDVEFEVRLQ